jgi:hypothetical protein
MVLMVNLSVILIGIFCCLVFQDFQNESDSQGGSSVPSQQLSQKWCFLDCKSLFLSLYFCLFLSRLSHRVMNDFFSVFL